MGLQCRYNHALDSSKEDMCYNLENQVQMRHAIKLEIKTRHATKNILLTFFDPTLSKNVHYSSWEWGMPLVFYNVSL